MTNTGQIPVPCWARRGSTACCSPRRYSRMYAAEFDIAEGVAVVLRAGLLATFTDSRYIESAQKNLRRLRGRWRSPPGQGR